MADEAEAVAAPASTPPFTRFIANVSLPQKFDTKGNPAANPGEKKMDRDLESVRNCPRVGQKPSTLRVAMFITCIDPAALEIHTGLPFQSDDDGQNINKVLEL